MKNILLLIIIQCSLFINHCIAQPTIQWEQSYGGSLADLANSIIQTNDGGYIVAGYSKSTDDDVTNNHGENDYWVVKLDSQGVIQWENSYGGSDNEVANSIIQTRDSGYVIGGYTGSNDDEVIGIHSMYDDYWLVKINDSGVFQWGKCYGGSLNDDARSVIQTNDGGFMIVGASESTDGDVVGNYGAWNAWVVKTNDTGAIQWTKCYGGSEVDGAMDVHQTIDGGYILACSASSVDSEVVGNHGGYDYWVVKIDSIGTIQWSKCYGGSADDLLQKVIITNDGGYALAGVSYSSDGDITNSYGNGDYWIVKIDSGGIIQWQKSYGGSGEDIATSIVQNSDASYYIGGYTQSYDGEVTGNHGSGNLDYWVIKINSQGSMLWEKCLGGSQTEYAYAGCSSNDGSFLIAGASVSDDGDVTGHHGTTANYDYWVVKLFPDSITTGINEVNSSNGISIYPNPTNSTITLHFNQSGIVNYELRIIDVFGREIYKESVTSNDTKIDVSKWSEGVYFYQITSEKETYRGKFIVN